MFIHQDAITQVKFVKNTHYFFTCSKDFTVKQFDGDTYEEIQIFETHFDTVWGLAISHIGDFVFTGSADGTIRVLKQTKEQLFLHIEREQRLEKQMLEEGDIADLVPS